jgi:hypothetical protein
VLSFNFFLSYDSSSGFGWIVFDFSVTIVTKPHGISLFDERTFPIGTGIEIYCEILQSTESRPEAVLFQRPCTFARLDCGIFSSAMSLSVDPAFYELLSGSYERLVGMPLIPPEQEKQNAARWLYEAAPFCVLAHNTARDPVFIYGNKMAQACFEYSWDELMSLPSSLSAEEVNREERQRLLNMVKKNGFATNYRGLRIAKSGRRFWIEDVTVWQLVDSKGDLHGQAAIYRQWRDAE